MTPPKSLNEEGAAHWERFVFSVETFLALVDERYPEYHDEAGRARKPVGIEVVSADFRTLSITLFGF